MRGVRILDYLGPLSEMQKTNGAEFLRW